MNFLSLSLVNYILYGIIILLLIPIIYLVFHFVIKKKDSKETILDINKKLSDLESSEQYTPRPSKSKNKKKKGEAAEKEEPFTYSAKTLLAFDKILNDMVVRDDGSLYSMVLHCRGINFDLMSEEEKSEVQYFFVEMLNSIDYPIQIHVQTRVTSLKNSVSAYESRLKQFENELAEMVNDFNQLQQINSSDTSAQKSEIARKILKKQKLYECAKDLENQVERMSRNNFVFQNNYYIIVGCSNSDLDLTPKLKNKLNPEPAYTELSSRCEHIIKHLRNCGVDASILKSKELTQLMYSSFNQDEEDLNKLNEIIDSGFFRLYSSQQK